MKKGLCIRYTLAKGRKPDSECLKSLEESRKAFQILIVETARIISPGLALVMWCLTRFYKRTIKKGTVEYDFYLLRQKEERAKRA